MAGQPLNATFFAFKKRERGGVLLQATIAYAVLAIALSAAFWFLNQQAVADYFGWIMSMSERSAAIGADKGAGAAPDMSRFMPPASVMAMGGWYFLFMLLYYILFAAYEAACLRWMIRSESGGFMGLSLGADTWRVYFGYWMWLAFFVAAYFACIILFVVLGVSAGIAAHGNSDAIGPVAVIFPLLGLLLLVAMIYFAVRFAPAAATSIAEKRFAFFDAWKVTKGRFWALLGAFVLLWLMFFVGILIASFGMSFAIGMGAASQLSNGGTPPESPDAVFAVIAQPQFLIPIIALYALILIGAFVYMLALFGINARAALGAIEDGKIQAGA